MSVTTQDLPGLDEAIPDPDLRWIHFFNGRLLTGDDLATEQRSGATARALLGQAVGAGVAYGLQVRAATTADGAGGPALHVEPGLAVNAEGATLPLAGPHTIELTAPAAGDEGDAMGFGACDPSSGDPYAPDPGIFLLTIEPASTASGRAAVSGLPDAEAACAVAFDVDGVSFHLLRIHLDATLSGAGDQLRNRLAHRVFGTDDDGRRSVVRDPFAFADGTYGLLDQLAATCPCPQRVPLALVEWTSGGVGWVDNWSVRRRITAPEASDHWPTVAGDRRRAECEAMWLQFQEQLRTMHDTGTADTSVAASDDFAYLPPAGLLPLAEGGAPGFDAATFFGAQAELPVREIDAARVVPLLRESLGQEAIAVDGSEAVELFSVPATALASGAQSYVLFAKTTLSAAAVRESVSIAPVFRTTDAAADWVITREGASCKREAAGWFPIWLPDGMRMEEFAATARAKGELVLAVVCDALDGSGEQATVAAVDIHHDDLRVVTGGFPDEGLRTVDNSRFRYGIAAHGKGQCVVSGLRVTLSEE